MTVITRDRIPGIIEARYNYKRRSVKLIYPSPALRILRSALSQKVVTG
jgi:hypothetical protein